MTTLTDIFNAEVANGGNTDKGTFHSYDKFYEKLFHRFHGRVIRMLEIGVRDGSSLRAWRKWFAPDSAVYGMDNWSEVPAGLAADPMAYYGDTCKPDTVFDVLKTIGGKFDIVIDDGAHHPYTQVANFAMIWPRIADKGLYVIEDVEDIGYAKEIARLFGGVVEDRRDVKERHDDILVWFDKK